MDLYANECIDLTNIDDSDESDDEQKQKQCVGPTSILKRPISLINDDTINRKRTRKNDDAHIYNPRQTKRARIVIDCSSDSEDIDLDFERYDDSETSISSDESLIPIQDEQDMICNDMIISNDIFKCYIIMMSDWKKRRGKTIHTVTIRDQILPNQQLNIKRNNNGEFYCNDIPITDYLLSKSDWMKVEVQMIKDPKIYCISENFKIPKEQRIELKEKEEVWCCCGSTYEKAEEYGIKIIKYRKNTKKQKTKCRKRKSNTNTKQVNGVKIHVSNVPMVQDQKLHIKWTVDGVEDIDKYIIDDIKNEDDENDENDENEVNWIKCNGWKCGGSWQHKKCIDPKHCKMIDNGTYKCPLWCAETVDGSMNISTTLHRNWRILEMIESMYSYNRNKNIVQYGGNKSEYNKWSKSELITLALKLAVNIGHNTDNVEKGDLINKIMKAPIFTQTPPKLCEYIASIKPLQGDNQRIAELGAGHGNITCCIHELYPNAVIDAFEINGDRVFAANTMYKTLNINFIERDIFSMEHLKQIDDGMEKYDRIIFNPSFESSFGFIFIAFQMLKDDGYLIVLLPNDFFDIDDRIRLSKMLSFKIVERYDVGKHDYYPRFDKEGNIKPKTKCKPTADSIWILKKLNIEKDDLDERFNYHTISAVMNGHL